MTSDRTVDMPGGPPCDPGITKFCVIAGTSVQIDSGRTLGASGPRPLVVISTSKMGIDGVLDVASHINTSQHSGPGADSPLCLAGTPAGDHGGGWGGSFGTKGGNGGAANGALAGATLIPTTLQGGCKGSNGEIGGGTLGHGGGAVYLIATTTISVNGSIKAFGESGTSTDTDGTGGGGGGSGGMIVFEAQSLTIGTTAQIFANGGGGGEGVGGNQGVDGSDALGPGTGGVGGSGGSTGGDGGAGGFGTMTGGNGAVGGAANQGGGGGGGGAGVIKVFRASVQNQGMVSPPFS